MGLPVVVLLLRRHVRVDHGGHPLLPVLLPHVDLGTGGERHVKEWESRDSTCLWLLLEVAWKAQL